MVDGAPPVTRLKTFVVFCGPVKVALPPVGTLNSPKL